MNNLCRKYVILIANYSGWCVIIKCIVLNSELKCFVLAIWLSGDAMIISGVWPRKELIILNNFSPWIFVCLIHTLLYFWCSSLPKDATVMIRNNHITRDGNTIRYIWLFYCCLCSTAIELNILLNINISSISLATKFHDLIINFIPNVLCEESFYILYVFIVYNFYISHHIDYLNLNRKFIYSNHLF